MSFQALGFLWLLPLAGLPVLIHLLNRRRRQRVEFPSLMFLRSSTRRRLRRFRILQALLLALRVLTVILLTLAFARPVWRGFASPGEGLRYIILIDNSYSMQYRRAGGKALDIAKEAASAVAGALDGQFAVGVFSNRLSEFLPFTGDSSEVLRAVERVELSAYPASYASALEDLREILEDEPGPHRVIIFSDLNRAGFRAGDYDADGDTEFLLVEVSEGRENIWIEDLSVSEAFAGVPSEFEAEIMPEDGKTPVHLVIEGRQRHYMEHPGGGVLRFSYTFDSPGLYGGWLKMQEDTKQNRIRMDSVRYFAVNVRPRVRVLIVDGTPGYTLMEGQSFFAARALAPGTYRTFAGPVVVSLRDFKRMDIDDYDVVLMLDAEPDMEIARKLSAYSSAGGGVGFFAGENTLENPSLVESLMPLELDPSRVKRDISGRFEASGAFVEVFHGEGAEDRADFARVLPARPTVEAEEVLSVGGTPLLWVYSPGRDIRGNTAFFASTANLLWGDFALKGTYPAFIHELVRFLARPSEIPVKTLKAGDEISSEPGQELAAETETGVIPVTAPVASVPGIYRTVDTLTAVNVDTSKGGSGLEPARSSDIDEFFSGADVSQVSYTENLIPVLLRYLAGEERSGVFLMAAFIALACEEVLRKIISGRESAA